jgi:hypothetical protein
LKTGILLSELLGTITRSETFVGSEAANHTALPEICQTLFGTLRDYLIVAQQLHQMKNTLPVKFCEIY